jgi:glyoxylase-like metal-dependent hydrolase (beta-lactamase superfamily II)
MSGTVHRRHFIQGGLLLGTILEEVWSLRGLFAAQRGGQLSAVSFPQKLVQVEPDVFLYNDTCNVYVVRSEDSAILVDLGSGRVLDFLSQIGVRRVAAVFLTHHHRDQCQGHHRASSQGLPLAVPEHERFYCSQATDFWQGRRLAELYNMQNNFFSLAENATMTTPLRDYERFSWKDKTFFILPSPGHTPGSVTVLVETARNKVAFTGDLITAEGKVPTLHDLQYNYAATDGIDLASHSLLELKKHEPAVLCPSHGAVINRPVEVIERLEKRLRRWYKFYNSSAALLTEECRLSPLTPHLLAQHSQDQMDRTAAAVVHHISPRLTSTAPLSPNFYAVLSQSRKALLVDFGISTWNFFYSSLNACTPEGTLRFIRHSLDELLGRYPVDKIDVCIPTHPHDENIAGIPYLQSHFGTKVYSLNSTADMLSRPGQLNLGAQLKKPVRVDRWLEDGETFDWEEYRFTVARCPGHSEFQMAMACDIDGQRVVFCGDALSRVQGQLRWDLIFRNSVESDSHLQAIEVIESLRPEILAPTHGPVFRFDSKEFHQLREQLRKQRTLLEELVPVQAANEGINPNWICLSPFYQIANPGDEVDLSLRVRNYRSSSIEVEGSLVLPPRWSSTPESSQCTVAPGQLGGLRFRVQVGSSRPQQVRQPIFAEVILDGRYLGQRAECLIVLETERRLHLA